MKLKLKSTARLAITAGLCASMAMGAAPVMAIAEEVVNQAAESAAASADGASPAAQFTDESANMAANAPAHEQEAGATASEDDASLGVRSDVTPLASKVQVATQDDLRAAMENADVTQIELMSDIALKGEWAPLEIKASRVLTILGNGHTISGLSVFKNWLGPNGTGIAGDGGSCDYYCGFISNNLGNVTISNLTFVNAEVDVKVLSESKKSTGSSCLGVVVGNNMGTLKLTDVTVENSVVRGYTKVGALVGFAQQGKVTLDRCAVRNSEIVLEADGTDPEACFAGVVLGYGGQSASIENGIALSGNKTTVADSVKWGTEVLVDECGTRYVLYQGTTKYGLTNETYSVDSSGVSAIALPAAVDGYRYGSVGKALDVAKNGDTVELASNVQEDVVIPEGKSVTLDLAGYKLTNKSGHTIVNKGALVLKDSSEGTTGVVDNTNHGKAALVVEEGASAEINGGTLRRSKEAGTANGDNGNSYYTVLNKGKLEINDGTTVELLLSDGKPAAHSSVIANGWYSGAPTAEGYNATLTINGGTIKGGKYVKNDSYGTMIVNGGKIVDGAEASVLNWNVATINGGTFDPSADAAGAMFNVKHGAPEKGSLVVNGGTFVTTGDQSVVFTSNDSNKSEDAAISGGTFQGNPPADEYVVPGSGLVKDENGNYVTVDAKIVYASDKIVDGVFTYDVKGGEAQPITEADLLALVTMNVEGYKLSVDASALPALNKAIGAADTSAEFKFAFSAVKDGAATRAVSDVEPLVVTVKLSDSTVEPAPEPSQKVTVTFETGLGSSFTKEVEVGSKLDRPADPARDGWKFVGWFTKKASDGTVSDEWNFEKGVVEGDMTLYGGWVKVGSDGTGSEAKPGSALPQTGDASMLPILAAGGAGVAAVAAGALISKRRKAE